MNHHASYGILKQSVFQRWRLPLVQLNRCNRVSFYPRVFILAENAAYWALFSEWELVTDRCALAGWLRFPWRQKQDLCRLSVPFGAGSYNYVAKSWQQPTKMLTGPWRETLNQFKWWSALSKHYFRYLRGKRLITRIKHKRQMRRKPSASPSAWRHGFQCNFFSSCNCARWGSVNGLETRYVQSFSYLKIKHSSPLHLIFN